MSDQPKVNAEKQLEGQLCVLTMNSGRRYTTVVIRVEKYTILVGNQQGKFAVLMKTSIESISPKAVELKPD